MARGISLHVGVNKPGPKFPGAATLRGAEKDAHDMGLLAAAKGFALPNVLSASDATYENVTASICSAAATLTAGDIFLFTFAGHGFQQADQVGAEADESDEYDEVLVLFDLELFDDVFRKELLPKFAPGVRFLGIADACHSHSFATTPPPPDLAPPPASLN